VKLLGFDITRAKAEAPAAPVVKSKDNLRPVKGGPNRGWFRIMEPFSGAWQRNISLDTNTVLSFAAVYSCVTLISQDIGKLRIKVVEFDKNARIWREIVDSGYEAMMMKPNDYQNHIKFLEYWIISKLLQGNAYGLKQRANGKVVKIYVLDPTRVTPLVSTTGDVYYRLATDNLSELPMDVVVPASEIIHDPMLTLFHPLVGVSPLYACGLSALQGLNILDNATKFFGNQSQPGGILVAPGEISEVSANQLKQYWEENFTGANAGKIAVVGDGLKYEPLTMKATDAQLVEQLKLSAETVCSCFHVPAFMIGAAPTPALNNVETLTQLYYSQCLQSLIESFELCMDLGLDLLPSGQGIELDLTGLFRMDTLTRYSVHEKGIKAGMLKPNEARRDEDLEPVEGGDTPYMQQQNYSLAALNKRDQNDPFAKPAGGFGAPTPAGEPAVAEDDEKPDKEEEDAASDAEKLMDYVVNELEREAA